MADSPSSASALAPRLQRPTWKDPRLIVGVLLVLLSVVAVVGIVRASDRTQPYLAATRDITVGESVSAEDFRAVDVGLAETGQRYLTRDAQLAEGAVATQPIYDGQLVPRTSLGAEDSLERKPMSLTLPRQQAAGLETGQTVDVWVTRAVRSGEEAPDPELVVSGAEISRITRDESALGAADEATVQVLVGEAELPDLIRAQASDSRVTLVPAYRSQP